MPRINNYENPEYFDLGSAGANKSHASERAADIYILPERIAKGFKALIRGLEDGNVALAREGAHVMAELDRQFASYRPLIVFDGAADFDRDGGEDRPEQLRDSSQLLQVGAEIPFQQMEAMEQLDRILSDWDLQVLNDPNSSSAMDPLFKRLEKIGFFEDTSALSDEVHRVFSAIKDWITHHRDAIHFGVCHDVMCDRAYVKAKETPHQKYCSSKCRKRTHDAQ